MIKFQPGRVVGTPAAIELMAQHYALPEDLLDRHVRGDWGDLSDDDRARNEEAVESGERLLSSYLLAEGSDAKVWIVTEATGEEGEREYTTVMLPGEY